MQAKKMITNVVLAVVSVAILAGLHTGLAERIAQNDSSNALAPLYEVMPEAGSFDTLYTAGGESKLANVPETVVGVYSETSGKGYVLLLSTTQGFTGEPIEISVATDPEGKISGIALTNYPETRDFGTDTYPQTYLGQDSALGDVQIVAGVTYSSSAFKGAVADGLGVLVENGLIQAGVKSDDQILTELLTTVHPGFCGSSGALQAEEIAASGSFVSALKAENETGYAFFAKEGDASFLVVTNATGEAAVYDVLGEDVTDAHAALADEALAASKFASNSKDVSRISKLAGSEDGEFISVKSFGTVTTVLAYADGSYGFAAHPNGFNEPMAFTIVIDADGAIAGFTVDAFIQEKDYFSAYTLDESSYREGFIGLNADSYTGEQALISGATVTTNAVKRAVADAFAAYETIIGG